MQSGRVEDRGLEPLACSCRNTHVSGQGGAKSGAVDGENRPIDPDLAHLIGVWDSLKPDTRTAIVEAARASDPPSLGAGSWPSLILRHQASPNRSQITRHVDEQLNSFGCGKHRNHANNT